jgi:para-nitrobenzyl esterase
MPATKSAIPRPRRWARLALLISAAVAIVAPLAASTGTASATQSLIVRTDNGFVQGVKVDDVRQFRGIPFAAPPVGENRWRPPQPAASWDGVRDATQFG